MIPYARSVLCAVAAASVITPACSGGSPASSAPASSRPPVAVTVADVRSGDMLATINVVGSLAPKFAADVKSEVSGTVVAVNVTEWVSVRKGQVLAKLDTSEEVATIEAMKAAVAQARVGETRAKREHERAQQLKQYGLITPQALDDAQSAVEAAEAAVTAAQAQVRAAETRLGKSTILSPMDGVVAFRGVSIGDRVENMGGGAAMFRIVDNRLLDLTVSVPSTQLADVSVGQAIVFSTDAVPGRTFTGKVMFINPSLDEASRSAKVVAEVPNRDGALKGGAFVKGHIQVAHRSGVLQVPREALLNWNVETGAADVLVVKGDAAEARPVKAGQSSGGVVEVVSGLQAGERVVVRGAFAVRSGDKVAVTPGQGA